MKIGIPMNITLLSLITGAQKARGTAIVIDVFRAFTTAAIALDRGVSQIVIAENVKEAMNLKKEGVGDLLMGEVDGIRPPGFDFGNSPYELSGVPGGELIGKTLVQSTRSGTRGVKAAARAATGDIYLGSFLTADATVKAVLSQQPDEVSIIAMGTKGETHAEEDELCASYLRDLLLNHDTDLTRIKEEVESCKPARRFSDPEQPQFHPEDLKMALAGEEYGFAIKVHREGELLIARKSTS